MTHLRFDASTPTPIDLVAFMASRANIPAQSVNGPVTSNRKAKGPSLKQASATQVEQIYTRGYSALVAKSYPIRREIETQGGVVTFTPHVPTDLDHDGTDELYAGWREAWGTCQACRMLYSANGTCGC